jgi:hypothetical protein
MLLVKGQGFDASEYLSPSERLSAGDIPRLKVPAGGGTTWELPDGSAVKAVEVCILARRINRVYYARPYTGEETQPDCISRDGVTGEGTPGGECASCPLGQFHGSTPPECRLVTLLYGVLRGSMVPVVLQLPPSSATEARRYLVQEMLLTRTAPSSVWTVATLERRQSAQGITYSAVALRRGDPVTEAEAADIAAIRDVLREMA